MTFEKLTATENFSRQDFFEAYQEKYGDKSSYELNNDAHFENLHETITRQVLKQKEWYEKAIWYGWVKRAEYEEFKKKYGL